MKKLLLIISLALVLFSVFSLVAFATTEENTEPKEQRVTITYNSNGGSRVASQRVLIGSKLTAPEAPTRQGYDFAGWYIRLDEDSERKEAERLAKEEGGKLDEAALMQIDENDEPWSFVGYVATEDITLYAKWVPNDEMPPMQVKLDGDSFLYSLGLMGKGIIGIFVVTLVIVGVVAILNGHGKSLEDRQKNK